MMVFDHDFLRQFSHASVRWFIWQNIRPVSLICFKRVYGHDTSINLYEALTIAFSYYVIRGAKTIISGSLRINLCTMCGTLTPCDAIKTVFMRVQFKACASAKEEWRDVPEIWQ